MILDVIGYILLGVGSIFYLLGGLGILRMPDIYNRLQAGTKATTLGAFSFILGVGLIRPEWLLKSIIIIIFIAITNPVGSSALARAALKSGIKPVKGTNLDAYQPENDIEDGDKT